MKNPRISVIIPAHNEEAEIEETLDGILNQKHKSMEIIVSNDGSKDRTEEIVRGYMKKDPRIKIISSATGHSGAYARNKGAKIAKGEILVFQDADARISDNFLKKVDDDFKKYDIQGLVHPKRDTHKNFLSKCVALMAGNNKKKADKLGKVVFEELNEFNLFIFKRDAFEDIGGYDDSVLYYDDTDISKRFYAKKYKALLEPEIMLFSAQPENFGEFYRRYKWSGEGIAAMKDYKERMRETSYLTFKFLFIVVPFLALMYDSLIGLALILLAIVSTYLFNLRTNKNLIWSLLMVPATYFKNLIEFFSMVWHYFFPRKNTRD